MGEADAYLPCNIGVPSTCCDDALVEALATDLGLPYPTAAAASEVRCLGLTTLTSASVIRKGLPGLPAMPLAVTPGVALVDPTGWPVYPILVPRGSSHQSGCSLEGALDSLLPRIGDITFNLPALPRVVRWMSVGLVYSQRGV